MLKKLSRLPLSLLLSSSLLCFDHAANAEEAPVPFVCNGQAYVARFSPAKLFAVDQTTIPFTFSPLGDGSEAQVILPGDTDPTLIELNNMGYRSSDNFIYALALKLWDADGPRGNHGLVKIDSRGKVFPVAMGADSPIPGLGSTDYRFPAGDISIDGSVLYVSAQVSQFASSAPIARKLLYKINLDTLEVTTVEKSAPVATVNVADWATNPDDGMLYGAQANVNPARIWKLNPEDGTMTIVPGSGALGLPYGTQAVNAYGGAWFNSQGILYLHRNIGEVYGIDLTGAVGPVGGCSENCPLVILEEENGESSDYNDATACASHANEGCTPGFWRQPQHYDDWPSGYRTTSVFDEVFGLPDTPNNGLTLLEALEQGGGGYEALNRHAVAALLNAAASDVNYDYTVDEILLLVQLAYSNSEPEPTKNLFEFQNERGCPR